VRLARRLGAGPGQMLRVTFAGAEGTRALEWPVGAVFESGGDDDDAWWIPLAEAQALAGRPGSISLVQARLEDPRQAEQVVRALEAHGDVRAQVLHALSSTEAALLERTRRLMGMVTIGVLLAAGLCALGTLTDLALERRREIALLKALGASGRDVVRQFGAESIAVGLLGGLLGWWMGVVAAQVIGHEVFRSSVAIHWEVFPVVLAISIGVALIASIGPIRLALRVDPAPLLRGE
jgi:putative ABC transport system permease protein